MKRAEQAETIDVAGEEIDPPAAEGAARLPVAPALVVETRRDEAVVERHVGLLVGVAEEVEELLVGRQRNRSP